jgi:pteridine reductase
LSQSESNPTQNQSLHNPLAGKVALITGAAQRIGEQMARLLHVQGVDLVIHYRSSAGAARQLADELSAARRGSVHLVQAELLDSDAPALLMDGVQSFRGRLDILVNNASSFYPTPIGQATEMQWHDLMGSNLKAPFFLSQAAAPLLRKSRGCIVNLVDVNAERPLAEHTIYSMAKAGNAMMVKSLAWELGPEVRVNGIAPGSVLWPSQGLSAEAKQQLLDRTALRRIGAPADIAQALLFLVRDADYITGQIINVDGGLTIQQ